MNGTSITIQKSLLTNGRLRLSAAILFLAFVSSVIGTYASADIVTLKDGAILRCQVIEKDPSANGDSHFLGIRIDQSVIWLDRSAIESIEDTPEPASSVTPEMEALVNRLMNEGVLVSSADEETKDNVSSASSRTESNLAVKMKEIRGWAYLYENEKAREDGKRTQILAGAVVPIGWILVVSPNTRGTLEIPNIGEIGLEAGTEIRFDEVSRNRSRRSFALDIRVDRGRCWLDLQSNDRVILTINSVRSIPQRALLYIGTTGKTGAVDILYLRGDSELRFSRNRTTEAPYVVERGQVLRVDPGSNRLPVERASSMSAHQQIIDGWMDWQCEPLAILLDGAIPSFEVFPSFRALPALHPSRLTIDASLLAPPETRSLGEILGLYHKALERYRLETGKYPTFDRGLEALTKSFDVANWKGPYIPIELPRRDPWGNPFIYDLYTDNGRQYADVRSNGPNGKDDKGLADDVR